MERMTAMKALGRKGKPRRSPQSRLRRASAAKESLFAPSHRLRTASAAKESLFAFRKEDLEEPRPPASDEDQLLGGARLLADASGRGAASPARRPAAAKLFWPGPGQQSVLAVGGGQAACGVKPSKRCRKEDV